MAAYVALSASEGEYEELEDDFLMIANEGQLAMELVEEDAGEANKNAVETGKGQGILKKPDQPFDMNEEDFRTRDI